MFYATVGVVAKLALYSKNGTLSKGALASCVILGYFSGLICAEVLIFIEKINLIPIICPLVTVFGQIVLLWIFDNSDKILNWGWKKVTKK